MAADSSFPIQLVFNFAWTPFFFALDLFWLAFVWLLVMWALVLALVIISHKISRPAFWMLLPYLLWCTFAAYLNCGIAILN
ncbi:tryptophan-rich sensory protein [Candidatus Saccharibacteria bacterium]|nr:tryptophan-rich sensory protein [Candidatus Saccharibacteria bacterium]